MFFRTLGNLQQEAIMNVFKDDCETLEEVAELHDRPAKASKDLMIYQDFVNQKYTQDKKVSSVNWHPTIHGKLEGTLKEGIVLNTGNFEFKRL